MGCGAYFAYVRHPFDEPADVLARRILAEQAVLVLPGTMFTPPDLDSGRQELRIAFANADAAGIGETIARLARLTG